MVPNLLFPLPHMNMAPKLSALNAAMQVIAMPLASLRAEWPGGNILITERQRAILEVLDDVLIS